MEDKLAAFEKLRLCMPKWMKLGQQVSLLHYDYTEFRGVAVQEITAMGDLMTQLETRVTKKVMLLLSLCLYVAPPCQLVELGVTLRCHAPFAPTCIYVALGGLHFSSKCCFPPIGHCPLPTPDIYSAPALPPFSWSRCCRC